MSSGGRLDLDDVLPGMGNLDLDIDLLAGIHRAPFQQLAVAADFYFRRRRPHALVLDPERDGLVLADDAEPRRRDQHHPPVALVRGAGDEGMNRRRKAERPGIRRHVVDAAVGNEDGAGDAVGRHVGERRIERAEQARAIGLAIRLTGLHHARLDAGNALQPLLYGGDRGLGLGGAIAKTLARALIDHHDRHRGQRIAILARQRRIGEREREQRQRQDADPGAAGAHEQQERRHHDGDGGGRPNDGHGDERGEADAEVHAKVPTGRAVRGAPEYGPDRPYSCRLGYTSRC